MKVDVRALGTFNELAHEGAKNAAQSLETLAGVSPAVEATSITLQSPEDVLRAVSDRSLVSVSMDFDGRMTGSAALVFDADDADRLAGALPGGGSASGNADSRLNEVGNILLSGFVDGWANHLGVGLEYSPPAFASGTGAEVLPDYEPSNAEQVLSFTSTLKTASEGVETQVFLFPERSSFTAVLNEQESSGTMPIPLDSLEVFNRMTGRGAERASQNITSMIGSETIVELSELNFLPIEQTIRVLDDDPSVGVVVTLSGQLSGYLIILFDESSAGEMAERLGAGAMEGEFTDMHRSAIEEIGNIMCSGFIDGWANALDASITHSPPDLVNDFASAIVDPVATQLATEQQFAFIFDSHIKTSDGSVGCEIFALPNNDELRQTLERINSNGQITADEFAPSMEASPEDVF